MKQELFKVSGNWERAEERKEDERTKREKDKEVIKLEYKLTK